jgi:transposase InsO family protein
MEGIYVTGNKLYVSYSFLRGYKVSQKDLENWSCRKVTAKKVVEGKTCVLFDTIPDTKKVILPSKTDLLAEYHLQQHETKVDKHYEALYFAHSKGYIKHLEHLKAKYPTLVRKKINDAAKLLAVWTYIIDEVGCEVATLYNAFNKIYPNKYKTYNSFANAKSKAMKNGAEFMAIDQRWFTTPLNVKEVSIVNQYWAAAIISIGKKYSNRNVLKKVVELCKQSNEIPPSLSWIGKYRNQILKGNYSINESRNGKEAAKATQQTFAKMQHALNANDQWQMDGWTLPFWVDGFKRYVIVIVRDAYSKKIVGSAVGESENTIVIMAALRKAIINTGCLPHEILTDNHSFNQTKEAANFKEAIAQIGTQYNVTHSPTYKSIIERYNRHLDTLCKEYHGYVGEGIKSKSVDARPKQELLDLYAKTAITEGEVMVIGAAIVEDFNRDILPKLGKTPNELFNESEKPNCFSLSIFDRVKILTAKTECKVLRGQITLKRGMEKHEFQLPAAINSTYNNRTVIVRYEDLNEGIYIYDKSTDEAIAEIKPKPIIHGAKANQTQRDIELLNKNKGRLTGVKIQSKKEIAALTNAALEANPEAYALLNKITTPKNVLKALEQNTQLKRIVEDDGINLKTIAIPNRESELDNEDFKPKKKLNESPFNVPNTTIKKVSLKDFHND